MSTDAIPRLREPFKLWNSPNCSICKRNNRLKIILQLNPPTGVWEGWSLSRENAMKTELLHWLWKKKRRAVTFVPHVRHLTGSDALATGVDGVIWLHPVWKNATPLQERMFTVLCSPTASTCMKFSVPGEDRISSPDEYTWEICSLFDGTRWEEESNGC